MSSSTLTTREQFASIWRLGGLSVAQLAKRVWSAIGDNDLLGLASELAYAFILSLFPLLLFLLAVFGLFAARGTQLRTSLMFYLAQALPGAAYQLVTKTIDEITRNTGSAKLTLGIGLALFSASGGVSTMMSGLNRAYAVRDHRSWFKARAIAIALTIALAIMATISLTLLLMGGELARFLSAHLHLGAPLMMAYTVVQYAVALFLATLAFSTVYYFGPDLKEQHWYWITPGSIIGVLIWIVATVGFRVYLHYFNTYSKTYGSLGAVIILLIWFYVTGLSFLLGGEINAQIEHAAAEHGHPEAKAPGEKISPADREAAA